MTVQEFLTTEWKEKESKVKLENGRVYKLHKIVFYKNKLPLLILACKTHNTLFHADYRIVTEHVTDNEIEVF